MKKTWRWLLLLGFLMVPIHAVSDASGAPAPFLWEWIMDVCHHPIGLCSGAPPPTGMR